MTELRELVAEELSLPVEARVTAIAAGIAAKHGDASRAVLFYGSCLRQQKLDGLMLDFYLIVSNYRSAYGKRWLAAANRLIPPNVFYFEHDGLAAKYAVLSEADFYRLNGPETRNVSVWARFAQPSRLVWTANPKAREAVIAAVSRAAPTLLAAAGVRSKGKPLDNWRRAFALTYSAELRAERKGKEASVVDQDRERYLRFTNLRWRRQRSYGLRDGGGDAASKERCCRCCGWRRRAPPSRAALNISHGRSTGMRERRSGSSLGSSVTR